MSWANNIKIPVIIDYIISKALFTETLTICVFHERLELLTLVMSKSWQTHIWKLALQRKESSYKESEIYIETTCTPTTRPCARIHAMNDRPFSYTVQNSQILAIVCESKSNAQRSNPFLEVAPNRQNANSSTVHHKKANCARHMV